MEFTPSEYMRLHEALRALTKPTPSRDFAQEDFDEQLKTKVQMRLDESLQPARRAEADYADQSQW